MRTRRLRESRAHWVSVALIALLWLAASSAELWAQVDGGRAPTMWVEVSLFNVPADGVCGGCPVQLTSYTGGFTSRPAVRPADEGSEIFGVTLAAAKPGDPVEIAYGAGYVVAQILTIHGETECPAGRYLRAEETPSGFGCLEGAPVGGRAAAQVLEPLTDVDPYPVRRRIWLTFSTHTQNGPG